MHSVLNLQRTSNHNTIHVLGFHEKSVLNLQRTSNHNIRGVLVVFHISVLNLQRTSNHNRSLERRIAERVY